ncbi:MAG: sulfotransferase [Gammaproteobacteria bacterium]
MYRFVVGTGRCGSTLLSEMLAEHPDVLVLSEFFSVIDREGEFQPGACTGAEFSERLMRSPIINDVIGVRNDVLTARGAPGFSREIPAKLRDYRPLPGLNIALTNLGGDTPALCEAVLAEIATYPRRAMREHYRALFDWLARRLGRAAGWIERSGTSIELLGRYESHFPGARYVHIHRHGPSVALSLRAHRYIALFASWQLDPPDAEEIRRTFAVPIDPDTDPVVRRLTSGMPSIPRFGEYWSWMLARGMRALARIDPARYLPVRYEDLVGQPHETLARIGAFFELPVNPAWLDAAARRIDSEAAPDRLGDLDPGTRDALERACRPGMVLLGRENADGLDGTFVAMRHHLQAMAR